MHIKTREKHMTVFRKACSQNRADNAFTCVTPLLVIKKHIPLEIPRVHLDPGFVALKVWGPGSPMLQTLWFQPPVATTSGVWSPRVCYKMLGCPE